MYDFKYNTNGSTSKIYYYNSPNAVDINNVDLKYIDTYYNLINVNEMKEYLLYIGNHGSMYIKNTIDGYVALIPLGKEFNEDNLEVDTFYKLKITKEMIDKNISVDIIIDNLNKQFKQSNIKINIPPGIYMELGKIKGFNF